jgi:hypothetical protein
MGYAQLRQRPAATGDGHGAWVVTGTIQKRPGRIGIQRKLVKS